jgi:hypothetical protein
MRPLESLWITRDAETMRLEGRPQAEIDQHQAQRAHRIVNSFSLAFFDRQLKGLPAPLLEEPADDYPDVLVETRRGTASRRCTAGWRQGRGGWQLNDSRPSSKQTLTCRRYV